MYSPKYSSDQVFGSRLALLWVSSPPGPYTQCRGNGLAPVISCSTRPSAYNVSDSVVQTVGALIWTYGGRLTRRGAGNAVRPPAIWVKRIQPSPGAGSGSGTAAKVIARRPRRTVVEPMCRPPSCPCAVSAPSATSIQPRNRLAKRNRSAACHRSRSSSRSGGTAS